MNTENVFESFIVKGAYLKYIICTHRYFIVHTCLVMQPGEAAVRLRVQIAPEDAQAHGGLVVGLVGILLGVTIAKLG